MKGVVEGIISSVTWFVIVDAIEFVNFPVRADPYVFQRIIPDMTAPIKNNAKIMRAMRAKMQHVFLDDDAGCSDGISVKSGLVTAFFSIANHY